MLIGTRSTSKFFVRIIALTCLFLNFIALGDTERNSDKKVTKILFTTQGGSGHLQAAKRIEQDLKKKGIHYRMIDVVQEKYMRTAFINVGKHGTNHWNALHRRGEMGSIHCFASIQWVAEYLYGSRYYKKVRSLLKHYPYVDEIIDTQPLNSDKILKAIFDHNQRKLKKAASDKKRPDPYSGRRTSLPDMVRYRKVITDMPTVKTEQFWYSLKKVKSTWVSAMTLVTPLAAGDQDGSLTRQFYREVLPEVMSLKNYDPLRFSYGPLRQGFLDKISNPSKISDPMFIQTTDQKEANQMIECGNLQLLQPQKESSGIVIYPGENTQMHSLMLGSQIQEVYLKEYILKQIDYFNRHLVGKIQLIVFVFTGKNHGEGSLFSKIYKLVRAKQQSGEISEGLHIVPLGFQGDQMISDLYSRAKMILIRSGGLSCMEAEAVARGYVMIHSAWPEEDKNLTHDLIFYGMPVWEAGNALHALDTIRFLDGSRRSFVVNPELLTRIFEKEGQFHAAGFPKSPQLLPKMDTDILK